MYQQLCQSGHISSSYYHAVLADLYSSYYCYIFTQIILPNVAHSPHFPYTKEDCQVALDAIEKAYSPYSDSNRATACFYYNVTERVRFIRAIGLKADTSAANEQLTSPMLVEDGLNRLPNKLTEDMLGMHLLGRQSFGQPIEYEYLAALQHSYPDSKYLKYLEEMKAMLRIGVVLPEKVSEFIRCRTDQDKLIIENEQTPPFKTVKELTTWLNGRKAFIDIWTPRCAPCIREFQLHTQTSYILQMLGYTPVFISLNTDDVMKSMWEQRIIEDRLTGYHISASKELAKEIESLVGNSVPKYMIVDSTGTIVSKNAPRPSNPNFQSIISKF